MGHQNQHKTYHPTISFPDAEEDRRFREYLCKVASKSWGQLMSDSKRFDRAVTDLIRSALPKG